MKRTIPGSLFVSAILFFALSPTCFGQVAGTGALATAANPCPRFAEGSTVTQAPDLYSANGQLTVNLAYNTATDSAGRTLYCFTTPTGQESPTLHVSPGDTLVVNVQNNLPSPTSAANMAVSTNASAACGAATQNASSVNIHYHGTNTSPACGEDQVIHTLINSGQQFVYTLVFPQDEPPGLYWYHPHVHGLAEAALLGGASGAIVVRGMPNSQPAVAGLPQKIFVIRDQVVPSGITGTNVPAWDVSVNYVPIDYPEYKPAVLNMPLGQKQFWRVSNSAADTIIDLQLRYDGVPQTLQVVALDGVPTGSLDGNIQGQLVPKTDILIPPAGRAEFIVTGPVSTVKNATLYTLKVDTGSQGDNDPARPLMSINTGVLSATSTSIDDSFAEAGNLFAGLNTATVAAYRTLYFSEDNANQQFFITVAGQTPKLFSPSNPPSITTTQGSVEAWTVQNQALEAHEFHIHQIHFLLTARNGVPVAPQDAQMLDTLHIPGWSGSGPYPSVTVLMDFRGPDTGQFVYHCHILNHEDQGMMAIIQVNPK